MKNHITTLILLFLFAVMGACGGSEPVEQTAPEPEPVVPLTEAELEQVAVLVEDNICAECHGENLEGTENGPALTDIAPYWTENKLEKYIYNPEFFMVSHPEVKRRNTGYEVDMPSHLDLTEEQRRLLARWVLQQGE